MSPRVDAEERRAEIIQAAMRCFARNGYHRTSMDDVVAESGLSKGTLYWYFKNKQALFIAMLEAFFAELAAPLEQVVSSSGPVGDRLRILTDLFWETFNEQREVGDLMMEFWAESIRDEAINAYFRRLFEPYIDMLASLIEEGVESGEFRQVSPKAVASFYGAMVDGLWFQALVGLPIEDYVDSGALTDLLMNGLLPR